MFKKPTCFLIFISFFFQLNLLNAQYITNGSAIAQSCRCYQLTPAVNGQSGSVWNANKINLNNSFDFSFDIFFGCVDVNGADGIAFTLQPISTSVGGTGGGIGFLGISPSIGVLMDTYQNSTEGDPTYDHISINLNGSTLHTTSSNLAGPIQIINGVDNAEDCAWHVLRITWDAITKNYVVYIDGSIRVQTTIDLINSVFGGNPQVFWGFTAATGGLNNEQKFCNRLNAQINSNIIANDTCFGAPVTFTSTVEAFIPVAQYYWNFGDGSTSSLANPLPHLYAAPGVYNVKFVVKSIDGCDSDTSYQAVTIGAIPQASFTVNDTCFGLPTILNSTATIASNNTITDYFWIVDGITLTNNATINSTSFSVGNHTVKHYVKSSIGCVSDTAYGSFNIFPKPTASFIVNDTCENKPTTFISTATGNNLSYYWIIDGVTVPNASNFSSSYTVGLHTVKHFVKSSSGCVSDTANGTFNVYAMPVANFTKNDTCSGFPITLTSLASGSNITYQWIVDGMPVSSSSTFTSSTFPIGNHTVKHIVTNQGKCSDTSLGNFTVFSKPLLSGIATDVCLGTNTIFTATLLNPPNNNLTYKWLFQDGSVLNGAVVNKLFNINGAGTVKLFALNASGCNSDSILVNYNVIKAIANAGNDTIVVQNTPFTLNGSGNGISYNWQPSIYLNNNSIANPIATIANDQTFTLTVTTVEGCVATDDVNIVAFKGSKIYVPNVFTPNGDGTNDVLKPLYLGISKLSFFRIFNRWGQIIFTTNDLNKGWDALYKSKQQSNGVYIYMIKATDYLGKEITQKGTTLILR